MAEPVGFDGANDILRAPKGQEASCSDLPIFRSVDPNTRGHMLISCWRLTPDELRAINETGVIWFSAQGVTHPPIVISGEALVMVDGRPARAEPAGLIRKAGRDE